MIRSKATRLSLSLAMLLVGCATGGGNYDTPEEADQARLLELDKLISQRPNDPGLYYEKGNTHFDLRQFAEAVTAYERVLELAPETPKALTNLGLSLRQLNRIDDALVAYQKVLTYDPEDVTTLRNLKVVLEMKGDTALLAETTGRLAALDPRNEDLQREYADLLFSAQDYAAAADAFQNVIAINGDLVEDWYAMGLCYFNVADWDACERTWSEALDLAPYHPPTNQGIAVLFWSKRNFDRAWDAVYRCQRLGIHLDPAFLDDLRRDSGRE